MERTKIASYDPSLPDRGVLVCSAAYMIGLGLAAAFTVRLGDTAAEAMNTFVSRLSVSGYPFLRVLWLSLRALFPAVLLGFTYVGIFVLPFAVIIGGFMGGFSVYALYCGAHYASVLGWALVFGRALVLNMMCSFAFASSMRLFTARRGGAYGGEGLGLFLLRALVCAAALTLLAAAECIIAA